MRRNRGGFTIIEVMIFLVISGALLAAAMVAINGQQNRTEFTQGMRDIDSKLQDTLNDVSNGNFTYNDKDCTVSPTGVPSLSGSGTGIGTRSACLFLGEALQFSTSGSTGGVENNTRFAIYTVLGRRTKPGVTAPVSVNSLNEANPTAIAELTTYKYYQQGITATSVNYTPSVGSAPANAYTLIGIYTGFTSAAGNIGNSGADASQALQAYTYKLAETGTAYGAPAENCINNTNNPSTPCPFDQTLSTGGSKGLGICFDSNNGTGQTAMITIYNTAQGVNTRLDYNPAAGVC